MKNFIKRDISCSIGDDTPCQISHDFFIYRSQKMKCFVYEFELNISNVCLLQNDSMDELPPITGGTRGELIMAMKFVPPDLSGSNTSLSSVGLGGSRRGRRSKGSLYVLLKEAKNLQSMRPNGTADPVCKL